MATVKAHSKGRRSFVKGLVLSIGGALLMLRGPSPVKARPLNGTQMPRLNLPPFVVPAIGRPVPLESVGPSATGPPPFYTREFREWHKNLARAVRQRRGTIGHYETLLDLSEVNRYDRPDDPHHPVVQWTIVTAVTGLNGETVVQTHFTSGTWYFSEPRIWTTTMDPYAEEV
jgi:hypothetical protein